MTKSAHNGDGRVHRAALGLTALLALVAFTIQWGVVSARLDGVEKRLDEIIVEIQSMRLVYTDFDRRLSFLEGLTYGSGSSGLERGTR
ncbi:MAG: hypothetical protein EA376_01225 [Phycisphaeraceae bacterium]|nr:MAG: hypothetical protein EA376_01225 [Phycisphaeraceae bacterium]